MMRRSQLIFSLYFFFFFFRLLQLDNVPEICEEMKNSKKILLFSVVYLFIKFCLILSGTGKSAAKT